jgi:multidrug efflux pump subunit AcrB
MDEATAADLAAIKRATREMHEAIKDARQVKREMLDVVEALAPTIDRRIEDEVAAGLARYQESLNDAITKATAATYRRFDTLADIILGERGKKRERLADVLLDGPPATTKQRHDLEAWKAEGEDGGQ